MRDLYTIGHSVHSLDRFLELLTMHGITALCDVRSSPYSRFTPQFNRETLKAELLEHRMAYIYLGKELGHRSSEPACYENGRLCYDRLAGTVSFRQGLARLQLGMDSYRIALMCAEKDPVTCHLMILICRHLRNVGVEIGHILEDGSVESNQDAEVRLLKLLKMAQEDLFFSMEEQIARAYDQQSEKIAYTIQEKREPHE